MNTKTITRTALSFLILSAPMHALAQDEAAAVDILPAQSTGGEITAMNDGEATHPPVRLTPDKSELIKLDRGVRTIIVGNPEHVNILADTNKTLVLVPRMPGATHFTAIDQDGEVIMQRHIIVASPKQDYVRVRRSCAGSDDEGCQETSVFYCPDMCHEIQVITEESEANDSPFDALEELAESAGNNGGNSGSENEQE